MIEGLLSRLGEREMGGSVYAANESRQSGWYPVHHHL
jgi:hypothetical protein